MFRALTRFGYLVRDLKPFYEDMWPNVPFFYVDCDYESAQDIC